MKIKKLFINNLMNPGGLSEAKLDNYKDKTPCLNKLGKYEIHF